MAGTRGRGTNEGRAAGNAGATQFSANGGGSVQRGGAGGGSIQFFSAELQKLLNGPDGPVAKDLTKRAIRVQANAKRLCPVDTGRLRSSIAWRLGHDSQGLYAIVGTNVAYAVPVEFGTRFSRAQPFLRPALMAGTQ